MIRRPPRSTRTTHPFPTRRSPELFTSAQGPLARKNDTQLAASILNGLQTPGAALAMPAQGGNPAVTADDAEALVRSEEHTSELQSLMRISYAVFCLKKKIQRD